MDDKHSKIEYHEFEDDDENINNSLYMSVEEEDNQEPTFNASIDRRINQSSTFRSIDLQEPNHNYHDIWKPNFKNSWNFGQPRTYYDTEKLTDSIEETKDLLKKNMTNINDRKSKLNNIETISEMLEGNATKFKDSSKNLKYQMLAKYTFHSMCIVLLILFIITLIVIIVKS